MVTIIDNVVTDGSSTALITSPQSSSDLRLQAIHAAMCGRFMARCVLLRLQLYCNHEPRQLKIDKQLVSTTFYTLAI